MVNSGEVPIKAVMFVERKLLGRLDQDGKWPGAGDQRYSATDDAPPTENRFRAGRLAIARRLLMVQTLESLPQPVEPEVDIIELPRSRGCEKCGSNRPEVCQCREWRSTRRSFFLLVKPPGRIDKPGRRKEVAHCVRKRKPNNAEGAEKTPKQAHRTGKKRL